MTTESNRNSTAATSDVPANPFSTRYVRPGAVPYVFDDEQNAASLLERLSQLGWCAQIVGPHGSGKSTLVAHLVEQLGRAARPAHVLSLHDGQRRPPRDWMTRAVQEGVAMIVVDGYEQLSRWSRFRLRRACRRHGWGLLVTAHRDVGLPTLLETSTTLQKAYAVVERIAPDASSLGQDVIERCYTASGGNMRETLFLLYDEFEKRRRP